MRNKKIGVNFDLKFDDITDLNPSFARGRVAIAYAGRNRNRSSISKDVFEAALPSLANCPLVGRFDEEAQDFGSHDLRVKVDEDGDLTVETATMPFGVVPETMNAQWIDVTEDDGTVRPYLFCDVILWKRQPGYECLAAQGIWHQSMEIDVNQYVIDHDGYCVIEDMTYEALCILGNSVEPCFESASIQIGNVEEISDYREQFAMMMKELRMYYSEAHLNTEGGRNKLTEEKKNEILAKYHLTIDDVTFEISDDMTEEVFEGKVAELAKHSGGAANEESGESQSFAATYNQKRDALRNALDPEIVRDGSGKVISETYYYLVDFDDDYAYVEKYVWTSNDSENENGRFAYTFDDTSMSAAISGEFEKMIMRWLTEEENIKLDQARATFEALEHEFEEYRANHSYDNHSYEDLQAFKDNALQAEHRGKVDEILDRFSDLSDNEEFQILSEKAYEFEDLDALEKECYAIRGKMYSINQKPAKKPSAVRVGVPNVPEDKGILYGGLFEKYGRNK